MGQIDRQTLEPLVIRYLKGIVWYQLNTENRTVSYETFVRAGKEIGKMEQGLKDIGVTPRQIDKLLMYGGIHVALQKQNMDTGPRLDIIFAKVFDFQK